AGAPSAAQWVAPIAVDERHGLISGKDCPCFGIDTELDLEKVAPGAFRIMNIDGSRGGTGQQVLAEWILHGYDGSMPLGWYYSDSGAKFNAHEVKEAMELRLNEELLFPVYRRVEGEGSNARYEVVGWIGFLVTGFKGNGNSGKVFGSFTRYIAQGIQSEKSDQDDFGVRTVALVE
ncbi:MAG: hypothetical protein M3335_10295, partial [Actinomycetota bacterium]|nr:hypothetical protein [Actinomycetota bacterium]